MRPSSSLWASAPLFFMAASARFAASGWQPGEETVPGRKEANTGSSRVGVTPTGWHYTYYADGSALLRRSANILSEGWSMHCKLDAMTDDKKCTLTGTKANIAVIYSKSKKPVLVCLAGHDFPGRTGAIRLDTAKAIATDTDGCVSGALVQQISQAETITTRIVRWPHDHDVDGKYSLGGFPEAVGLLEYLFDNTGQLPLAPR